MRTILDTMEYAGVPLTSYGARDHASAIPDVSEIKWSDVLLEEISKAIVALWDDPAIRSFYETSSGLLRGSDSEA